MSNIYLDLVFEQARFFWRWKKSLLSAIFWRSPLAKTYEKLYLLERQTARKINLLKWSPCSSKQPLAQTMQAGRVINITLCICSLYSNQNKSVAFITLFNCFLKNKNLEETGIVGRSKRRFWPKRFSGMSNYWTQPLNNSNRNFTYYKFHSLEGWGMFLRSGNVHHLKYLRRWKCKKIFLPNQTAFWNFQTNNLGLIKA
jgi:hypothetical protein